MKKSSPYFPGMVRPVNINDTLYEAGVILEHHFGEPFLDLKLYCVNRKKSNGFFREGLIIDEEEIQQEFDPNEITQTIEQKFTIHEIMLISGIFQMNFNTQISIDPVVFPIEFQSPFHESFANLFDVYYFDELKLYNLDFDVVGVGEHK